MQHLHQVLHQTVIQRHAVQKHLEGVLACIGVRGRLGGLLHRGSLLYGGQLYGALQQLLKAYGIVRLPVNFLRQRNAVLPGAGTDKGGGPHLLKLAAQGSGLLRHVPLWQSDALRR